MSVGACKKFSRRDKQQLSVAAIDGDELAHIDLREGALEQPRKGTKAVRIGARDDARAHCRSTAGPYASSVVPRAPMGTG